MKNKKITVSYFGNKHDNRIKITENTYWQDFRKSMLSDHSTVDNKDFILFNGMQFSDNCNDGYIRRCADNVSLITMLVLDYDGNETIDSTIERFSDYEYAAYTSYSHKTESKKGRDCFRIVFPLNNPVAMSDYKARKKALLKWAGDVDKSSTDISRGFYLPSCQPENIDKARCWFNHGNYLDLSLFNIEHIPEITHKPSASLEDEKKQLIKEKLSEIFLGYEPDWVKVMWAMKNSGYTLQDFIDATVYGNLMNSKTVQDCKKRWKTMGNKNTNTGYLINLIRKKSDPDFLKPKTLETKRNELLDMKQKLEHFKKMASE